MASLPVNNNVNVLAAIANRTSGMPDNRIEDSDDSFGEIMSRVNSKADNLQVTQTAKIANSAKSAANTAVISTPVAAVNASHNTSKSKSEPVESAESVSTKQTDTKENGNVKEAENAKDSGGDDYDNAVSDSSVSKEQTEAVNEAGEKLVEEVAKEMELTPEEVEEAMAMLGFSAVQLLEPDNMKQLLITLSGNEDHLSIITDGELYGHLNKLLEEASVILEDLQTDLGLSAEELNAVIADVSAAKSGEEVIKEEIPQEAQTKDGVENLNDESDKLGLEGMKDYAVTVNRDGKTVKVEVTVDDASGDKSMKEEVTSEIKPQTENENKQSGKESQSGGKGESSANDSIAMQTPIEQQPTLDKLMPEQPITERYIDTQDIMNQIGEYMKLNLRADVQELELQLHPASLGSVNIQITAKDGMITAQFTTQNEAVKAAIESQLVQLKTQFDEQGLKVDAVEVAVADYRFNQNFSGNEENTGTGADGKKNRRKINLNELDLEELPEDMEESDRIAAQMMAQSGSTVDYTA